MRTSRSAIILGILLTMAGGTTAPHEFPVHASVPYWAYSTRLDSGVDGIIVSYPVEKNMLGSAISDLRSKDQKEHSLDDGKVRELWKYYTRLVPFIVRRNLATVDLFTDGPDKIAAAVYRDDDDAEKWHLAIDYQDAFNDDGSVDKKGMGDVLLHETGHMVTLGTDQVMVDYQQCTTYESDQGCSKANSYINHFYDLYWKTHADYIASQDTILRSERSTRDFYQLYQNEFLTPYASTGVEEDMAETFAYFIQYGKPYGSSIAYQKVRFFYSFPSFVRLRKVIRLGLEPQG